MQLIRTHLVKEKSKRSHLWSACEEISDGGHDDDYDDDVHNYE
jgi:hypothetical protein